ncbi:hypothetical protein N7456_008506 [Penicillium angulare]|uniref:Major facilitator superfamily (MFS) profile domain-containing protein n=1 Tax=Penicillium angulare TaxID=116970 RepID=A0A9W9K9D3_9EURO|nr:hypothetical protein N7456_008506 [Penicillium angulare]
MASEEERSSPSTTGLTKKADQHSDPESPIIENSAKEEDTEQNASHENADSKKEETPSRDEKLLGRGRLFLIWVGLWLAVFLYSLDQTIVSNAIPSITNEFNSTSDEGWYGSSYLLTTSAFQLFFGRIYSNFSIKYTLIISVAIFEVGSLIGGVAPTSNAFIAGRAIQGVGCAGITAGAYIVIGYIFPLRYRPICIASIAMVFAIAAVLGPVIGGIFTSNLTWRWCFYINLPFGGVTLVALLFFLPPIKRPEVSSRSIAERLKKVDFIGLLIFIPTVTCMLVALQWGGTTYPWNDGRVVALFVVFGVLLIAFVAFEIWKGPEATLPMRIITQRSVAAAAWNALCNGAAFFLLIYYIPVWQQVVRDASAADSGIAMLPFILGVVIMAALAGFLITKIGYYAPFMLLATTITPIGEGLMTTWTANTSFSHWVGYQALAGLGIGLGQQQPQIAIQAVLPKADIPAGASIVVLLQTLSGAIFVTVGQNVLQNKLMQNLNTAFPSGSIFDVSKIITVGTSNLRSIVSAEDLDKVVVAYNSALTRVFLVAAIMSSLTIIGSLSVEWKSIKPPSKKESQQQP